MGLRSNSPWNSRSRLSAKSDFLANGMGGKTKISGSRSFCLCSPFFLDSVASRAARVAFSHPVVSCFACLILSVKCCTWSRLLILSWRGQFVPSCPDVTLLELSLAQSLGIDSTIPYNDLHYLIISSASTNCLRYYLHEKTRVAKSLRAYDISLNIRKTSRVESWRHGEGSDRTIHTLP